MGPNVCVLPIKMFVGPYVPVSDLMCERPNMSDIMCVDATECVCVTASVCVCMIVCV